MPKADNFIHDFQKDHSKLINLVTSFHRAIESANTCAAKEILSKIEDIANRHFSFEETYLYPRLRRLILEKTENLRHEQQTVKNFISESRVALDKDRLAKNKLVSLSSLRPQLSKLFKECNDLVFLAEKFSEKDKEDLNRRFKDCCRTKSLVGTKGDQEV